MYLLTIGTTSVVNTPPYTENYNFPVVRQTQEEHDNISVFDGSDTQNGPVTSVTEVPGQDSINTHLNSVFDNTVDYLSYELK